jgi:DNA-binding XRE family transcriptional regulator
MITLSRARQLLDFNLSLITIGDKKIPNYPWKKQQLEPLSKDAFEKNYISNENNKTHGVGIVTGYKGLEVIDIDLKVLPSLKEQQDFWSEYISFLSDNIDDFDNKFCIYKTVNNGYHILYRCSKIEGNKKLAKLEGYTEAIIETRGIGGYVFVYENKVGNLDYTEIKEISELDRSVLFEISQSYNFVEKQKEIKIEQKEFAESKLTPWDDYNSKVSIFDIISDSFEVVRNIKDKYIIRRFNATSAHSGYVYKNSGCMYLFSTGTIYPNEKLISPFAAYTIKYHNSNYKESSKKIYSDGYGSRLIKEPKEITETVVIDVKDLDFPLDIFPESLQNYIRLCNNTLDSSIDYMGCSLLWMSSVIIGNSINIRIKNGWIENCTIWLAVVGKAGLGKTPSISNIIFPLMKANNREIKNFIKKNEKYHAYKELDKKEQKNTEEIKKPSKTQFIVNDITLEALVDLHEESDNAVGVFKDELAGWFKDMNKYRAGSDLEFWLSSWSGKSVSLNRKTAKSAFVEKPLIPVLGGIQPSILTTFYTDENKDNGFIDRMLLSFPELEIESYNDKEISKDVLEWYSSSVVNFYDAIKKDIIKRNIEMEIEPIIADFSDDAKIEWIRIFNDITNIQNSDQENEYMKSMLPKQKSYIPRFALILNTIDCFYSDNNDVSTISKESVLKAEKLSKYFIAMAKKIKVNTVEVSDIRKNIYQNKDKSVRDKFTALYKENPKLKKKEVADMLGVSRQTIYDFIKDLEKCN